MLMSMRPVPAHRHSDLTHKLEQFFHAEQAGDIHESIF